MNQEAKTNDAAYKRKELAEYHAFALGSRIFDRRESVCMTQEELSIATGLKPTAISHFERGRRKPCIKNLLLLCSALKCSPNHLLLGEGI